MMEISKIGAHLLAASLLGFSLFGCGGSTSQGGERQGCYANGTCNAGLSCLSNICVSEGGGGAGGGAGGAGGGAAGGGGGASGHAGAGGGSGAGGHAGSGGAGGRAGVGGFDGGVVDARNSTDTAADGSHAPTLSGDVQPLFTQTCAVAGCHVPGAPPENLLLTAGMTYSQTVGVVSQENPPMDRVTPGDATNSYLYLKIIGQGVQGSGLQPPPSTGIALTQAQKNLVRDWINAGAKND
jgi:hypothetical protein